MNELTRRTFVTGSAALLFASPEKTEAQSSWPARPIRIVVPYPAGGQTDGIARAFGDYLARQLGKPTIIENKAGAGGVIGVTDVKRAEPDGTTILCTISSSLIQNRVTVKDLPYDPERDFIYLTMVSGAGGPVVAARKTGATNLREFIEYGKKVGSLNWGSYGVGSTRRSRSNTASSFRSFSTAARRRCGTTSRDRRWMAPREAMPPQHPSSRREPET
jgi:tripartite-type tricarboxylate transporter receptor subunit TctC